MKNYDFHASAAVETLFQQALTVAKLARELGARGNIDLGYGLKVANACNQLLEGINDAGRIAIELDRKEAES